VGFNGIYPYQTHFAAGTETHMAIKKQETLPLPMSNGYIDKSLQAFSVEVPLVPPKTTLSFNLWTTDTDNQRACEYIKNTIRPEQRKKLDRLAEMNPKLPLNADVMSSLQAKEISLFAPGYLMSSEGRREVEFITNRERKVAKEFDAIYKKESSVLPEPKCVIPIFAAERADGNLQYFNLVPAMMTWVFTSYKQTKMPDGRTKIETENRPPEKYVCFETN